MQNTVFYARLAMMAALALIVAVPAAKATPALVIDALTGEVLYQEQATQAWFPASLTKLMTTYIALKAVRDGRVTPDTPFLVSARAAHMAPSKMGFKPGTEVTLDNALKMLMVKSPNDVAVTVAEGLSGSVEDFATEMNATAAVLGLHESAFYNPNGLPDERQVSSARDMAMIARALYLDFPQYAGIFDIGALQLASKIIPTHNGLLGRYPGADGMKTGFTCAAGFNVVASATRNGRHLIAVVLGSPSAKERTARVASLLDDAFGGKNAKAGLVQNLPSEGGTAPNMRSVACGRRVKGGSFASEIENLNAPLQGFAQQIERIPERAFLFEAAGLTKPQTSEQSISSLAPPHFVPVPVYVGRAPGWRGTVAAARADPAVPTRKLIQARRGAVPVGASAYAPGKANPLDAIMAPLAKGVRAQPLQLHPGAAGPARPAAKTRLAARAANKAKTRRANPAKAPVAELPPRRPQAP